jgi:uncharacterized protein (DUF427 family)
MSHVKKIPGTDHPITVELTAGRVVVRLSDRIIADTDRALTMREASYPPVYYIPLTNVDLSALLPSSTTTYCPYKGQASYHGLTNHQRPQHRSQRRSWCERTGRAVDLPGALPSRLRDRRTRRVLSRQGAHRAHPRIGRPSFR